MVIALGSHVTAGRRKPVGRKELLILFVGNFGVFDFEQTPWLKKRIAPLSKHHLKVTPARSTSRIRRSPCTSQTYVHILKER